MPIATDSPAARVLRELAGPDAGLRDGQQEALDALSMPAARVLVVQATGWGKSAVYWMATATRRAAGAGPTLVVSPLLSLMRDQVAAAERAGLHAATINSSNVGEWQQVEQAVLDDQVDVLLVSPERLASPSFGARVLDTVASRIGLLVIDEAHSVSDWGHDFRPDYRRVTRVLQSLAPDTPVLATTATANERVVDDVAAQLGSHTTILRGPLARPSLQLAVTPPMEPLERFAWVVDQLPQLPGSGIVYTLTVADAQRLAQVLTDRYGSAPGLEVAAYTGALDGAAREELEGRLRRNEVKALVATSALGMGYDKPDLGFVVHVGAPPSPVAYYQQVGRAGRAIDHALVALLLSAADEPVWDYFATATIPRAGEVRVLLAHLSEADSAMSVPALEAETGLRRTKVELLLKQLAVEDCVERTAAGWLIGSAPWEYDDAHYESVLQTRRREADIMRRYVRGEQCLMQLLQESLDDPEATPCGRCSVCLGRLPHPLVPAATAESVQFVRETLRASDLVLDPRKMWPGGAFGARGKIPEALAADPGRVLVHGDAPEWGPVLPVLASDGPVPQELADHAVRQLSRWRTSWASRPSLVLGLPAAGHAQLVGSLVEHIGTVGRMRHGNWPVESPPEGLTSADEAAHWRDRLSGHVPVPVEGETVLLVIDATSSGWPATVAAAALREAGAVRVLPMVIHRTLG